MGRERREERASAELEGGGIWGEVEGPTCYQGMGDEEGGSGALWPLSPSTEGAEGTCS